MGWKLCTSHANGPKARRIANYLRSSTLPQPFWLLSLVVAHSGVQAIKNSPGHLWPSGVSDLAAPLFPVPSP